MGQTTELAPLKSTRFLLISHTVETGSTNADLLARASEGANQGMVLVTDHQTAGRGRQNRTWHDDPGNALLVSVLVHSDRICAPVIPFAVGMAAVDAVSQMVSDDGVIGANCRNADSSGAVGLKWPNDVLSPLFAERKLAGILAESAAHPEDKNKVVVVAGMGLNIRWSTSPPKAVQDTAVTLEEILGRSIERNEILYKYLTHLEKWLAALESKGIASLIGRYRDYCLTLGRNVRFVTSSGEISGRAENIADSGALQIRSETDGQVTEVTAGDAHHV